MYAVHMLPCFIILASQVTQPGETRNDARRRVWTDAKHTWKSDPDLRQAHSVAHSDLPCRDLGSVCQCACQLLEEKLLAVAGYARSGIGGECPQQADTMLGRA